MAGKFRGDTFKFPDEVSVKAPLSDEKLDIEIEGAETEVAVETPDDPRKPQPVVKPKAKDKDAPEIEIVDDTPEDVKLHKPLKEPVGDPTEDELKSYSDNVRKRIEKLTHARYDEQRAKDAALREKAELEKIAQSIVDENRKLQEYVQNGEKAYIEKVQALAKVEMDAAKERLTKAYEAGDAKALTEAQEQMMLAGMKIQQAENFRPTPLQQHQNVVQSTPSAPQTPSAPKLDSRTSAWMEKNPWFGDDKAKAMTSYAMGLHQELVDKYGEDFARTDEYFSQIDAELRRTFPTKFEDTEHTSRETKRIPATTVAPATRATSAKKIRLTQTQVSIAKKLGVPLEVYAKHVAQLEK